MMVFPPPVWRINNRQGQVNFVLFITLTAIGKAGRYAILLLLLELFN